MKIAIGGSRMDKKWKNKDMPWEDFCKRLASTIRTTETVSEFLKLTKAERDSVKDVGGFVGGSLKGGTRKGGHVLCRSMLSLDMDYASPGLISQIETLHDFKCAIYSTHKHTPKKPRLRLIIPLLREITEDEYPAVARMVAKEIGIDMFDDTTYQPHRLMYWPSTSSDGEFIYREVDGKMLDPDTYLAKYADWRDASNWPVSSRQSEAVVRQIEKQKDPLSNPGAVGAFCRTHSIEDAIEVYLKGIYEPSAMEGRYDYIPADSNSGVVVYDSKFAYSHHATDPASEKLLNAFDLVRIHKFGDMDDKASFTAMSEFALSVPKVKAEMSEMARVAAAVEFAGNASEDDPYPFIVVGARGGAKVSPPKLAGHFRDSHDYFLTKGQSGGMQLWVYDGSVYARTSELELKGILMRYVGDFDPDLIKMKDMAEAASQIMADDKIRSITELDADENIVVMENGLYNIATGVLSPHTPNHIGSIKIPVRWNATANKANVFNRFLCELTGGDPEKIQFLKEFIGIALSNVKGYKTKKALFLVGEGNTGKSQLRSLVERLIGIENCTSVALEVLERRFGTGLVFGKRLVGSNDLGFADIPELQVFKQLTGGDSMLMENKFADGFTAVYNGVLWFSMNRLPSFGGDRGGHVFERIVIIECGEPCPPEKQDRGLLEKMYAERDGIVAECFAAASVVIGRGYKYTLPKASASANEQYKKEVSTVKTFASEYCEAITAEVSAGIKSSELYRQYRGWCFDSGYHPSSAKVFTREAAELFGMRPKLFKIHKQDGDYYRLKYRGRAKDDFTPIPGERGDGDGTDAIIEDDLPF